MLCDIRLCPGSFKPTTLMRISAVSQVAHREEAVSKQTKIPPKGRRWKVHLTVESKKLKISSSWIRGVLAQILLHVERDIALPYVNELHLVLTDDARIRTLNREYRRKDKATDVLSFPQFSPAEISGRARRHPPLPSPYLGDLVVSTETTVKQAKEFGVSPHRELVRLLTHGVLHLCGYDHEKVPAATAQRMRRRERYIRAKLEEHGW